MGHRTIIRKLSYFLCRPSGDVYLAGYYNSAKGRWLWNTGESIVYQKWKNGYPRTNWRGYLILDNTNYFTYGSTDYVRRNVVCEKEAGMLRNLLCFSEFWYDLISRSFQLSTAKYISI